MRVLFASTHPHLPEIRGGLQTTTHDLCLAILDTGAEAAVLCGRDERAFADGAALRPDASLGYPVTRAADPERSIAQIAREFDASAIVVQSGARLARLLVASLDTGRPTAAYLHNVEPYQVGGNLVADPQVLYFANSDFTARRWAALSGIACRVTPPVVRAEGVLAGTTGAHVLFVNPVAIKGVEFLFALAAACPELPFLVVESWNLNPAWRRFCRARARALGNIRWLAATDDMRPVYAEARLLLMPSVWEEAFGRTAVEAQLNGLPVLASNRGALPEVVGEGGVTLDLHGPFDDWVRALRLMHAEPERWSARAQERATGHVASTPLIVADFLVALVEHGMRHEEAYAPVGDGRDPADVPDLCRQALTERKDGQAAEARRLVDAALAAVPHHPAAIGVAAQLDLDAGDATAARRRLLPCLRRGGAAIDDLWRLLAIAQMRRSHPAAARRWIRRALRARPDSVEALRAAIWLEIDAGDGPTALDCVQRLLSLMPEDETAHVQAAFAYARFGQLAQAQDHAQRAASRMPGSSEAWRALADVRYRQQRYDEAEFAIEQSLRLEPQSADGWRLLGGILMHSARAAQAGLAMQRALEASPTDLAARLGLAEARLCAGDAAGALTALAEAPRHAQDRVAFLALRARTLAEGGADASSALPAALDACLRLLRTRRDSPEALAVALRLLALGYDPAREALDLASSSACREALRHALGGTIHRRSNTALQALATEAQKRHPEDLWFKGAGAYAAAFSDAMTAEELGRKARDWHRALRIRAGSVRTRFAQPAAPRMRPRIAYVCSQQHESLLRPVLAAHSPEAVDVFLFATSPIAGLPGNVQAHPLVPETLADACAANAIDIVIDAGGLQPFDGQDTVLSALARRVAPVQAGWLGTLGPSGGLFDVLLTDEASLPETLEGRFEERIVRLAGGQWCWEPPSGSPDVAPPPLAHRGSVTFGVTSRSLRLNEASIDAQARIVAATQDSAIRYIGAVVEDWPLRREILGHMQRHGVAPGRVSFDPFLERSRFLHWLAGVDLVLDTFPGGAGRSLLDVLWMGVPFVSASGDWPGARQGASLLHAIGLPECTASGADDYVARATRLASDAQALGQLRADMRGRVQRSGLLDGRRVAAQVEALCRDLLPQVNAIRSVTDEKSVARLHARWQLDGWLCKARAAVRLPTAQGVPALSVVIVLFNQAGLTRRTLQALADQRGPAFETIIIDNASTDRTGDLLERVEGARIVRNPTNLGFLRAANQGAAFARGRHIAFLNNDAILQEGALAATLAALDADPSIGALGGRIVLSAGGLQEAGNRIFRDGRTGGIGRGEDPFGHAARAARSTDYCSGVYLATPVALWRALGGFDPLFAPAYCEDADYCLRVWQSGRRVRYEPGVLLEHLEWGSAAAGEATRLMERSRRFFRAKHARWLEGQPEPMRLALDADRWGSPEDRPRLPRVLFLENEVPHMARGGGLPRSRQMLQALVGWPVTFYPLWNADDEWSAVYASLPATVEVVLGRGLHGLERFLQERLGVYDVLLVSRPPNLAAIQPLRKRRPDLFEGMRLVYDAEALFALREIMQAALSGRPLSEREAAALIDEEVRLAQDASDVLVVSGGDAAHFRAAGARTHLFAHSAPVRREAPGPGERHGLLFVGAIHPGTPNEDGLLWFIEQVLPRLGALPEEDRTLTVVGACSSERVAACTASGLKLLGAQPALEPFYDRARVFVAPARFAGGVPIKVIEAAANGIAVVSSAILAEQLEWDVSRAIGAAPDAEAFARMIVALVRDDEAWIRQRDAAWEECTRRYDPEAFGRTLRGVLAQSRSDQVGGRRE